MGRNIINAGVLALLVASPISSIADEVAHRNALGEGGDTPTATESSGPSSMAEEGAPNGASLNVETKKPAPKAEVKSDTKYETTVAKSGTADVDKGTPGTEASKKNDASLNNKITDANTTRESKKQKLNMGVMKKTDVSSIEGSAFCPAGDGKFMVAKVDTSGKVTPTGRTVAATIGKSLSQGEKNDFRVGGTGKSQTGLGTANGGLGISEIKVQGEIVPAPGGGTQTVPIDMANLGLKDTDYYGKDQGATRRISSFGLGTYNSTYLVAQQSGCYVIKAGGGGGGGEGGDNGQSKQDGQAAPSGR